MREEKCLERYVDQVVWGRNPFAPPNTVQYRRAKIVAIHAHSGRWGPTCDVRYDDTQEISKNRYALTYLSLIDIETLVAEGSIPGDICYRGDYMISALEKILMFPDQACIEEEFPVESSI